MLVNLFAHNFARQNAFAGTAASVSPNVKYNFYFRPNPNAYARAENQPARFSSPDVVQTRAVIARALILIKARYPTATPLQALRILLLAYNALNAAKQKQAAASHASAQKPQSDCQSGASAQAERKSYRTRYSAQPSSGRSKPKSRSADYDAKPTGRRQSAHESERTKIGKPDQAQVDPNTVPDAFKALGLPATATFDEARSAYKKAAMKYHPDRGANKSPLEKAKSLEMFKAVNEAHQVLAQHFGKA